MFHCKWDLAEKITLRIYSKKLTNGKKKKRIELQQNPQSRFNPNNLRYISKFDGTFLVVLNNNNKLII